MKPFRSGLRFRGVPMVTHSSAIPLISHWELSEDGGKTWRVIPCSPTVYLGINDPNDGNTMPARFALLSFLRSRPGRTGHTCVQELNMSRQQVTRAAAWLEKQGLVERNGPSMDERIWPV